MTPELQQILSMIEANNKACVERYLEGALTKEDVANSILSTINDLIEALPEVN